MVPAISSGLLVLMLPLVVTKPTRLDPLGTAPMLPVGVGVVLQTPLQPYPTGNPPLNTCACALAPSSTTPAIAVTTLIAFIPCSSAVVSAGG